MTWASTMAMSYLSRLGGGGGSMTCHSIEHALSGYYDVTHGAGLAALFPAWMKYHAPYRRNVSSCWERMFRKRTDCSCRRWLQSLEFRIKLETSAVNWREEKNSGTGPEIFTPIMLAGAAVPIGKKRSPKFIANRSDLSGLRGCASSQACVLC